MPSCTAAGCCSLFSQGQGAPWAQAPLKSGRVEMLAASGCKIVVFDCRIKSQSVSLELGTGRGKSTTAHRHRLHCLRRGAPNCIPSILLPPGAQAAAAAAGGGEGRQHWAAANGERVKYHFKEEAKAQACEYITRRTIYAQARVQFDTGIMKKRRSLWMT